MTEQQTAAEKYLLAIRGKMKQINSTLLEIEALEYAASGQGAVRYDKDKVQGGPGSDRLAEFVSDAISKKAELEELLAESDDLKVNCYHYIKQLPDQDERVMLEWYYINAMPMMKVIERLCVSERKAYYIRDDALQHFGEQIS